MIFLCALIQTFVQIDAMKFVIVHLDPAPYKILPSTGSSIRLEQMTMALQGAGHKFIFVNIFLIAT